MNILGDTLVEYLWL